MWFYYSFLYFPVKMQCWLFTFRCSVIERLSLEDDLFPELFRLFQINADRALKDRRSGVNGAGRTEREKPDEVHEDFAHGRVRQGSSVLC